MRRKRDGDAGLYAELLARAERQESRIATWRTGRDPCPWLPLPRLLALRAGEPVIVSDWELLGAPGVPPGYRSPRGRSRVEPDGRLIPLESLQP